MVSGNGLDERSLMKIHEGSHICTDCYRCTDVCPVDIPVGTVFRAVGEKAQAIFDYHPGHSLDEAAPVPMKVA